MDKLNKIFFFLFYPIIITLSCFTIGYCLNNEFGFIIIAFIIIFGVFAYVITWIAWTDGI